MRLKNEATPKRLHKENDGYKFRRNAKLDDDKDMGIMPMIRLLNCIF